MLTNCFQAVHAQNLTSVAFPAIGTGQLGFPHRLVAEIMFDELRQFSSRNPETSLKDVRFVVYQKDHKSIQAFEEVLSASEPDWQEAELQPARALARPKRGATGGTPSRSISEDPGELIHIGAIDIDIVHGDLTQEHTDAIVNSSDNLFSLHGATSLAIVAAGGQSIVAECKRLGTIGPNGIAVTSAGHLPCSHIMHIDVRRSDLVAVIDSVLVEADSLGIESIAFPALGTGVMGLSPSEMAHTMLDAIERFTEQNPESSLKLVKIVIFKQSMMQSFRKSAYEKARGKKGWLHGISAFFERVKGAFFGDNTTAEESSVTRQHITFNIFGKSHSDITASMKAMQQLCDDECKEVIIDSEKDQASIAKLTSTEINQIRALEESLAVKIIIMNNQREVYIRIQGMPADTAQASLQIVNIFRQMEQDDKDKTLASVYAKQVQWRYAKGQSFNDYPKDINGLLEGAYQSKKHHVEWKENTNVKYRVTFTTMKETTDGNHTGVDVKREDIGGTLELPSHWSPMGGDEHVKLVPLQPSSQEYKDVESSFLSTAQQSVNAVKKIERVQNPSLYRQYTLRKEELAKRSKHPSTIERSLWHGTSANAITSINNGGFNRSYCGKNATVFGQGVYFAVGSSYSAHNQYARPDAKRYEAYLPKARVLTWRIHLGQLRISSPTTNPATSGFPYDSVVDNVSTPGIFVIFLDNQAYPEYLITFS
ncbi:hypothetical protein NP493_393g05033 [Ridgeia piscesae]|uniref:Poly [ADP-ribose] polymerase n=1 Tax=Ridgeia piscesae TaxID=27915 RepID=A0AAD9L354_RIDPI|nr:hypothetical protein NP493_393g05033 [Ridgeia piscesae]